MDLMRARVALRERPLLDIVDLAIRFGAAHAWSYAKMSLVVLVPCFAISWAVAHATNWWLGWTVTVALTSLAGVPFVALASRLVFADAVSTREALGIALRSLPGLLGARILQLLAIAASLIVAGLAWFWLGTILLFVVEVLVLEQAGLGATLGRANRLASSQFGDAVLTMLLLLFAPIGAAMLADVAGREILQDLLEVRPPATMFRVGGSWLALVGWWMTLPLLQTVRFFVYLDIRTRTEGWDIQTRFAAIAARAEAEKENRPLAGNGVRRAVVGAMALLAVLSLARPAHAVLDPGRAQSDLDASMREGEYTFCKAPRTPISYQARELCSNASAIPDCAGFEAECTKTVTPPPAPSSPPWWKSLPHFPSLPGFIGSVAEIILWVLVAALVLAILIPVMRAILRIKRDPGGPEKPDAKKVAQPDAVVPELPMLTDEEALLARAGELARAGDYAGALQHYLAASLRALDKRGAVRLARDRTNGEYVRYCGDPEAKPALRDIVLEVDRVQFGGEGATVDGVSRAAQRAMAIVRAVPAMLLAIVLLGATAGCGSASKAIPHAGDDPAGGELFRDVLRRQGMTLSPLRTSLASLPMPKAGEREPAVLVNLAVTDLDDDTRAHLAEWVKAGGVLVLVGNPYEWPKPFGATSAHSPLPPHRITVKRLLARTSAVAGAEDDEEDDEDEADAGPPAHTTRPGDGNVYAKATERGELVDGTALAFSVATERVATFDDGMTYAAVLAHGKGFVLGIATDELLKNAGIARPGNAAATVAILASADRLEMKLAGLEDGLAPPSTPVAALLRAGLGVGLVHGAFATLVLFFAVGVRIARPRPEPPPRRRAFAEHVEAVGSLYARTKNSAHALASYARFADERLHARMPRGTADVPAFLSSRAHVPLDVAHRLWTRALQAKAGAPPLGDEMHVLRDLCAVYSAAMAQERA